jgi:hypothetical protein
MQARNGGQARQAPCRATLHGAITKFEPEVGWGCLRADAGAEAHFERDRQQSGDWDTLEPGMRLRFREREVGWGPSRPVSVLPIRRAFAA